MEKENTKDRIQLEEMKLFSRKGYEAVSVKQITGAGKYLNFIRIVLRKSCSGCAVPECGHV